MTEEYKISKEKISWSEEKINKDKDAQQLQRTWIGIEKKYPLFADIIKSFLIIIKWIVIVIVGVIIFLFLGALIFGLFFNKTN
jgi:hypothetical protein